MIDLTHAEERINVFEGSERKKTIFWNNSLYMLKFPDPIREKGKELSYINNQYSEYIGSSIFSMVGIPTQETFLANYTDYRGKNNVVVACKNFCSVDESLVEAEVVSLSLDIEDNRKKNTVSYAYKIIEKSGVDVISAKERFWDMVVVDALIGNVDRHNGNWGFLVNNKSGSVGLAPVYDCGSSLSPLLSDDEMSLVLANKGKLSVLEYNVKSALRDDNGHIILYHQLFENPPDELKEAILRIVPKIDLKKIDQLIENIEGISDIRRSYYKQAVGLRFDRILNRACKKELKVRQDMICNGIDEFFAKRRAKLMENPHGPKL